MEDYDRDQRSDKKFPFFNFQVQGIHSCKIVKGFCQISGLDHNPPSCSFAMIRE